MVLVSMLNNDPFTCLPMFLIYVVCAYSAPQTKCFATKGACIKIGLCRHVQTVLWSRSRWLTALWRVRSDAVQNDSCVSAFSALSRPLMVRIATGVQDVDAQRVV